MDIIKLIENGIAILTFLFLCGGIIYMLIRAKVSDEFLSKKTYEKNCEWHKSNCDSKHAQINNYIDAVKAETKENIKVVSTHVDSVRTEIKEDMKEIKEILNTLQGWIMELLKRDKE